MSTQAMSDDTDPMGVSTDTISTLSVVVWSWIQQLLSHPSLSSMKQWGSRAIIPSAFLLLVAVSPAAAQDNGENICESDGFGELASIFGDLIAASLTVLVMYGVLLAAMYQLSSNPEKRAQRKNKILGIGAVVLSVVFLVRPLIGLLPDDSVLVCIEVLPF